MHSVSLQNGRVLFTDPRFSGPVSISLRKTTRLPESSRAHGLPPDLGPVQTYDVAEYADKLPRSIAEIGGVIAVMGTDEAFWIDLRGGRSYRPSAVQVACGKINAVNGEYWTEALSANQNYLVIGGGSESQPWIDGWMTQERVVRQFVVLEGGNGETVEEQLTGAMINGGIQIRLVEAFPHKFPLSNAVAKSPDRSYEPCLESFSCRGTRSMGVGAGAEIQQKIVQSSYGLDTWENDGTKLFVHLISYGTWYSLIGEPRFANNALKPSPVLSSIVPAGIKSNF